MLVVQSHLAIQLLSRISRSGSASHHTAKFAERRRVAEMRWPLDVEQADAAPFVQNSSPGWRGSMSAASPRPTSPPGSTLQRISPVRAS